MLYATYKTCITFHTAYHGLSAHKYKQDGKLSNYSILVKVMIHLSFTFQAAILSCNLLKWS